MPAYNEEEHISAAIQSVERVMKSVARSFEVIVVDDGSTDRTKEIAENSISNQNFRVIGYARNMGKGYAIVYGAMASRGDYIVFMDSDMEINVDGIESYLEALRHADFVVASKRHPESRVKQPVTRRLLSYGFNMLARLVLGIKVSDTQTGLKAFRAKSFKEIIPLLSVKRYAFDVEVLTIASLKKMKFVEMPVNLELKARFSVKAVVRMAVDLLGIAYRLRIKRWYQKNMNVSNASYKPIIRW